MATQAEIQVVRAIGRIREILEEVRDCGHDLDLTKIAVELYSTTSPLEGKVICPHNYNSFEILCSCEDCSRSGCQLFLKESGQLADSLLG